jgi:bifunctional DNA-binding transcriptional regulator/antitoxin component of YhaV-PrlF toxin-antitoxin module
MGFNRMLAKPKVERNNQPKEVCVSVPKFKGGALAVRVWLYKPILEHLGLNVGDKVAVGIGANDDKGQDYGSIVIMVPAKKELATEELRSIQREGTEFNKAYFAIPAASFPTLAEATDGEVRAKVEKIPDSKDGRMIGVVFPAEVIPR